MKVAVVGTVPASRQYAPFDDQEWKIWGCSPGNRGQLPRVDVWFELHGIADLIGVENNAWRQDYFAWLKGQSFPIYMQEQNEHIPNATVFPRDILLKKFGRNWFSSSIAWMMAYAIHQMRPDGEPRWDSGDEIGIFGVDMAATEEHYTNQKNGCIRFIEIAQELGIKVSIPLESCLGMPPQLYGYAEASRMGRRLVVREQETAQILANLEQQQAKITQEICYFKGALEDMKYMRRTFVDGLADAEIGDPILPAPKPKSEAPRLADFNLGSHGLMVPKDMVPVQPQPMPKLDDKIVGFDPAGAGPNPQVPPAPADVQAAAGTPKPPKPARNGAHQEKR